MVGINSNSCIRILLAVFVIVSMSACVSTEELYAKYDMADCNLLAIKDDTGTHTLLEQNSNTQFPWEPAVYFAYNSFELSTDSKTSLDRSMTILKQYPSLTVGLQGFTDSVGSNAFNLKLANHRVLAVRAYMLDKGIASKRMVLQPVGEVNQTQISDLMLDDVEMRRVEIMLLDDNGSAMSFSYAINE